MLNQSRRVWRPNQKGGIGRSNFNLKVNKLKTCFVTFNFPEQIIEIRLKYDLSAARISEILGMGANSWRNYESGEIPSKANANLIQMISKPEIFEEYIKQYSELEEKEREKLLKHIHKLKTGSCRCNDPLYRFNCQPDIYCGFKAFDRFKTEQVITYFAERLQPFKTKLNKLLFYADFVNFRNTAQSITGLRYSAIQFGPVPYNFDILFGTLAELDIIDIECKLPSPKRTLIK